MPRSSSSEVPGRFHGVPPGRSAAGCGELAEERGRTSRDGRCADRWPWDPLTARFSSPRQAGAPSFVCLCVLGGQAAPQGKGCGAGMELQLDGGIISVGVEGVWREKT